MDPQRVGLCLLCLLLGGVIDQPCLALPQVTCSNSVSQWSNTDVMAWLDKLGKQFKPYRQKFEANAIDGHALLSLTDDSLLDDFGVENKYHRLKILGIGGSTVCIDQESLREWHLNRIQVPEPSAEANTFATPALQQVLNILEDNDVEVDEFARFIANELDGSLHDSVQEVVRLGGVELLSHYIISRSAAVQSSADHARALPEANIDGTHSSVSSPSVFEEAKHDMSEILDAKRATASSMGEVQSSTRDLVAAMQDFKAMPRQRLSDTQRTQKKELLKNSFHKWRASMAETAAKALAPAEKLFQRSKDRLIQFRAGGPAVQDNLKALSNIATELSEAHAQRKAIIDSPDPKVQLAIEARSGALGRHMSAVESHISRLQGNIDHMSKIQQSKDKVIEQVEQFAVDANKKKKEWRDWHINRWWANMWGPEMETYDRQADQNIDAQSQERARAEKAKELLGQQIKEFQKDIETQQQELAQMKIASETWEETLKSVGLLAAELEVDAANKQFELARVVLMKAMDSAGIADPEKAAQVIGLQHKAQILISNAATKAQDIAQKTASFVTKFDSMIDSIDMHDATEDGMAFLANKLNPVQKTLTLLSDAYSKRMRLLDDGATKGQAVRSYLNSELAVNEQEQAQRATLLNI